MWLECEAWEQRATDQFERDIVLAWQVVRVYAIALSDKRVPDLRSLLGRKQTAVDQRDALRTIFGARVPRRSKKG